MSLETLLRQGLFKDFPLLLETLNGELGEYLDAAEKQAAAGVELLNDTQEHIRTDNHYYMDTVNSIRVMVKERQQLRSSVASIPQSPAPQQLQPAKVPAAAVPDAAPPSPRAVAERGRLQEVQAKLAKLTGQTVAYLDRILNGSNEDQAVFDMQVRSLLVQMPERCSAHHSDPLCRRSICDAKRTRFTYRKEEMLPICFPLPAGVATGEPPRLLEGNHEVHAGHRAQACAPHPGGQGSSPPRFALAPAWGSVPVAAGKKPHSRSIRITQSSNEAV